VAASVSRQSATEPRQLSAVLLHAGKVQRAQFVPTQLRLFRVIINQVTVSLPKRRAGRSVPMLNPDINKLHQLDKLYLEIKRLAEKINDVYRAYNSPGLCNIEACEQQLATVANQLESLTPLLRAWKG
jgi:hypothetical protein